MTRLGEKDVRPGRDALRAEKDARPRYLSQPLSNQSCGASSQFSWLS